MSTRTNRSAEEPTRPPESGANTPLKACEAVAYWLEDDAGYPVWWERPTPKVALTLAARGFENGLDSTALVLVSRTKDGQRLVIATGPQLKAMSEPFRRIRSASEEQAFLRFRKALEGPLDIHIDGATSYWLETATGQPCSVEFEHSNPALVIAHEAIAGGADPDDLVLVCRLDNDDRSEISRGVILADLARAAGGLPARPRPVTAGPPYPRGTSRGLSVRRPKDQ